MLGGVELESRVADEQRVSSFALARRLQQVRRAVHEAQVVRVHEEAAVGDRRQADRHLVQHAVGRHVDAARRPDGRFDRLPERVVEAVRRHDDRCGRLARAARQRLQVPLDRGVLDASRVDQPHEQRLFARARQHERDVPVFGRRLHAVVHAKPHEFDGRVGPEGGEPAPNVPPRRVLLLAIVDERLRAVDQPPLDVVGLLLEASQARARGCGSGRRLRHRRGELRASRGELVDHRERRGVAGVRDAPPKRLDAANDQTFVPEDEIVHASGGRRVGLMDAVREAEIRRKPVRDVVEHLQTVRLAHIGEEELELAPEVRERSIEQRLGLGRPPLPRDGEREAEQRRADDRAVGRHRVLLDLQLLPNQRLGFGVLALLELDI